MSTVSTAKILKVAVPVLLKSVKAWWARKTNEVKHKDNVVKRYLKNVRKAAEADALCDSVNDAFEDQIENGGGAHKHYGGKNPTKRIDLLDKAVKP